MSECLPPEGTEPNAFAWLRDGIGEWYVAEWCRDCWWFPGKVRADTPSNVWRMGYRFHSIIEPPPG
jgi:hypothetical protein